MDIEKGARLAVVINGDWANFRGVRFFLRQYNHPEKEIGKSDGSHLLIASLVDSNDPHGLWIELYDEEHAKNPEIKKVAFMIPWQQVWAIAVVNDMPAVQIEARRIGFELS
jgi:hypothetical protein